MASMASRAKKNNLLFHLPTDILKFQILTRLPVKSLLCLKSVCKSWNLLISENKDFMHTHLRNSNHDFLMLRCRTGIGKLQHYLGEPSQILIGCINGLLCFYTWQTKGIKITISNPATRQLLDIRALHVQFNHNYCVGFGFDSITNNYKVVYIKTIAKQPLVGFMYSSRDHCWGKIAPSKFRYTGGKFLNPEQPVIVNESLYWLNRHTPSRLTVISFDIRHQVFKLLPGSFEKEWEKDYVLMNMRDSVALMGYDWTLFVGNTVDFYIFNERCSSWSKMYIGPLIGKEPSLLLGQQFITCLRNNDLIFWGPDLKLYRVNPQTHTIKSIENPEKIGDKSTYIYDCCTYSESLISIAGMETLPLYLDDDQDLIDTSEIEEHYRKSGLIFECCCYTQIQDQVAL